MNKHKYKKSQPINKKPKNIIKKNNFDDKKSNIKENLNNKVYNDCKTSRVLKVRNKNVIWELIKDDSIKFEKICMVQNLDQDQKTKDILQLAKDKNIRIEIQSLKKMPHRRSGSTHEVLVGFINLSNHVQLEDLTNKEDKAFFIMINRVDFDTNIGMIARTAYSAGVTGIIYQGDTDMFVNDESLHYSLGAIARIPLVKMPIFEAIKRLKMLGFKVYALDMVGVNYTSENLCGPMALIVGEERAGLSNKIIEKCDGVLSITMKNPIDSLNVSISTAIVIYEKIRQESII
jgi:23S rRNA (guanosine2251-2'-O)-methyltransferase